MQKAKQIIGLALRNMIVYLMDYIQVFAVVRLLQFLFMVPVISLVFALMLRVTGYSHITERNINSFLVHPIVIGMFLLGIVIVLFCIYYEMGFLFIMAFNQQRGIRLKFSRIWQQLNRKAVYFCSFQTIYLALYIVLLLPLISYVLPFRLIQEISILHFMLEQMTESTAGRFLYASLVSLVVILGVRSIVTLPIFTIHPKLSIGQSILQSWRLSKKILLQLLVLLAIILIIHILILFLLTVISMLPLYVIERTLPRSALATAGVTLAFLEILFVVIFSLLQIVFSQVMVAVTYHTHVLPKPKIAPYFKKKNVKPFLLLVSCLFFILSIMNINSLENSLYAPDTKIIAHRGYAGEGVENTISGLVSAANAGADLIELDIQQTADGDFVVFHDRTLRRLTGKTSAVANMTLRELTAITVHENGYSDKITSLDAYIEMAQSLKIGLLIELKIHGKESENVLPRLVEKLRAHQVLDTYYVQAANPEMVTNLKKIAPNLRVGIVYALNVGVIENKMIDFIALEESFVSENLIEELRQQDIDLFVWTLNKDRTLQEFIGKNVSGVITDHPTTALEIRTKESENKYFLQRVMNRLYFVF